ncbi:MAG: ATP synthase F1 subunit delta [Bacteroidales bacterium]|nr:ATP synthase F1 subunit delta [Bacteroidales bacterium]
MNESKISVRYSKALFQSALEKNILGRIDEDMIIISEICSTPEMKEILASPILVPSKKSEILNAIFGSSLHKLSIAMIELVVRNGREKYLSSIARVFHHETKKHEGITESVLTSAVKVSPEISKQVADLISSIFKTRVDLKENIDENIIGGFILRVEDNYIDASVRTKLARIRKELTANTFRPLF